MHAFSFDLGSFVLGVVCGAGVMRFFRPGVRTLAVPTELTAEARGEILALIGQGKKIAAIRRHREATGSSLKHAKDAVEALDVRH